MTDAPPALLLTRPQAQAERFAEDCRAALAGELRVVISPVLRIVPREVAADLTGLAGIVLTSENGARALQGLRLPEGLVAYCVGDRTAEATQAMGLPAISAGGAVEDLIELILKAPPKGPLLHLRGEETRGDLAGELAKAGIEVTSVVAYDQAPAGLSEEARGLLDGSDPVVAPVFSPRSAALLGAAVQGARAPITVVALSKTVAEAWNGPETQAIVVAERPNAEAMLAALVAIYTRKLA